MRLVTWMVAGLGMMSAAGFAHPTPADDTLTTLNALLASSCANRPVLQVSGDGTVARKEADGGTMTFILADIGDITIGTDDQAHVLLSCKAEAACIERSAPSGAAGSP
jgi:hypothetical protein